MKRNQNSLGNWLISPILIVLVITILLPLIMSIGLSFSDFKPGRELSFTGLENYLSVFKNHNFWNSLKNNLIFVVSTVSLQLVIALGFTVLLSRKFKLQRLWISCIILPYAISPVVTVTIWRYMLNADMGIVNYMLEQMGMDSIYWFSQPFWAFIAIIVIYTWRQVPFSFVILYPARLSIDTGLYEAACIDGANGWHQFWYITLPVLKPTLLIVTTFRIIFSFRIFEDVWLMNRGGPLRATEVLAITLYDYGFVHFEWGMAAAVGLVILLCTVLVASPQIRAMYKGMFE